MAYRRPGVQVVQEFQALTPALVLPALPACVVGPAFQIADDSSAGAYAGTLNAYSYPSLAAGAVVDLAGWDTTELTSVQKPVSVKLTNAYIILATGTDGAITAPPPTDALQRFTSAAAPFASITPSATNIYYIDVASGPNAGRHLITEKISSSVVKVADELTAASGMTFQLLQKVSSITYDNSTFASLGIITSATTVTLPAALSSDPTDAAGLPLDSADDVKISYRALRPDLADSLTVFTDLDSLEAIFGVGAVVPTNPYAFGVNVALNNTTTEVNATGLRATYFSDETLAYQYALEFLESVEVYGIVILTQEPSVHQLLDSHVEGQSLYTVGKERIGFINRKLQTYSVIEPTSGIGYKTSAGTNNGTGAAHVNTSFLDPTNGAFITDNVSVGCYLEIASYTSVPGVVRSISTDVGDSITGPHTVVMVNGAFTTADVGRTLTISGATTPGNDGPKVIASRVSATTVTVVETLTNDPAGFSATVSELTPNATQAAYITGTRHYISQVNSNTTITLQSDVTNGFWGQLSAVEYRVTKDLSRSEEAAFLAGYAQSFANRRLVSVWPDYCYMTVSGSATQLPGFYLGCALVGMTAGLPSQQGFTNLSMTGFIGLQDSNDRYNPTQLDTIAGGGNLIILQDVAQAPVYVRHQLTTDTSSIQFQELSITKNVDSVAKFFRRLYQPFIGKYNITDALMDLLKSITMSGIDYLVSSTAPRVGGVLRGGSISKLTEDPTQPDTVLINIDLNIPYPLNNIKVTLFV